MTDHDVTAKPKVKTKAKAKSKKKASKKVKPSVKKTAKKSVYGKMVESTTATVNAIRQNPMLVLPMALAFIFCALSILRTIEYRIGDSDVGWHIMAGYNIRENGLNSYDPFGFTNVGYPWYNISWLWDIFVSMLDDAFGIGSMVVLVAIVSGVVGASLCYLSFSRGAGIAATAVIVYLASLNFLLAMTARPHLLTYLLTLLFLEILRRFVDGRYDRRALVMMLIPYLIWVNSHGHFVVALCITGAYGLELMWKRDWKKFKELFIFGVVCALLTLVNPFGIDIFEGMRRTTEGLFRPHISEWRQLNIWRYPFYMVSLIIIGLTLLRQRLADIILVAIWAFKSYYATRFLIIYTLVAMPAAAYGLSVMFYHIKELGKLELRLHKTLRNKYVVLGSYIAAALVAVGIITSPAYFDYQPPQSFMPKSEIKYIQISYPGARILNLYDYGGYMLYYTHGHEKTFFDGRADTAFPPALVQDYIAIKMMQPGWEYIADKYNIDVFFWPVQSPQTQGMLRTGRWRMDYTNGRGAVLVRTTPMPSAPVF